MRSPIVVALLPLLLLAMTSRAFADDPPCEPRKVDSKEPGVLCDIPGTAQAPRQGVEVEAMLSVEGELTATSTGEQICLEGRIVVALQNTSDKAALLRNPGFAGLLLKQGKRAWRPCSDEASRGIVEGKSLAKKVILSAGESGVLTLELRWCYAKGEGPQSGKATVEFVLSPTDPPLDLMTGKSKESPCRDFFDAWLGLPGCVIASPLPVQIRIGKTQR